MKRIVHKMESKMIMTWIVSERRFKNMFQEVWQDERGLGLVELALIIIIIIGLATLFKEEIHGILTSLIDNIKSDGFISVEN